MKKHFQGQHVLSPVRPGALGITVALFFFFFKLSRRSWIQDWYLLVKGKSS